MKLSDLSPGQAIQVAVLIGEQRLDFDSQIEEVNEKKHFVYLTPIMKNDKILTFSAKGVHTSIIVQLPDTKPLIFHNTTLNAMKREDGTFCYGVPALGEGIEFNRRGAYRCPVDCNCVMRIGMSHSTHDIIIRDISLTGFSFVFCNSEDSCNVGQSIHIVLNDYLDATCEKFSFQIYGLIVRQVELENGKVVYGCKLTDRIRGLDSYIAKKERARLQQQRGK